MPVRSLRGAITAENTRESIWENTERLLREIITANGVDIEKIISIFFTCTGDLDAAYPAVAARNMGITQAGLMCMQELNVAGSLKHCVRALLHIETEKPQNAMLHVYMKEAEALRPDLRPSHAPMKIAIDGPGGSGKSTVAREVAAELGLTYIDSGAMYRAVGYYAMGRGVDYNDEDAVCGLLGDIHIAFRRENAGQRVLLNGADVTEGIRSAECGVVASAVGRYGRVRERLADLQRELAAGGVVMDGRDIGTNVLPDAQVKIYLDADVKTRVGRRCMELDILGLAYDPEVLMKEIMDRDRQDMTRALSPLKRAEDAVYLDSSDLNISEVRERVLSIVRGGV